MTFKNYDEFFESVGDHDLHPKYWGECHYPVAVEELYQHFKARLLREMGIPDRSDDI